MAQPDFASVDDYLAAQPPAAQRILRRVRTVVRKAIPEAAEVIAYQIPTYKLPGGTVLHFAGWKDHLSIYPATAEVIAAVAEARAKIEVEKGTLRFSYGETLPVHLISHIAKLRAAQVAAKPAKAAKAAKPAKKPAATKRVTAKKSAATKRVTAKKSAATKRVTAKKRR